MLQFVQSSHNATRWIATVGAAWISGQRPAVLLIGTRRDRRALRGGCFRQLAMMGLCSATPLQREDRGGAGRDPPEVMDHEPGEEENRK